MPPAAQIIDGKKRCPKCDEWLLLEEFYKKPDGKPYSYCRPCASVNRRASLERVRAADPEETKRRRRVYVKTYKDKHPERVKEGDRRRSIKKFGITPEEYDSLLEKQGGVCFLCERTNPSGRMLAVDHCHDSTAVRGLLCTRCNTALGLFGDDVDVMRKAITYVEKKGCYWA